STAPFRDAIGASGDLDAEISRRFQVPPASTAMPDLEVEYDNDASPWYTLCEVRGEDRPGVLHTITVGFASAGVTVRSARVEPVEQPAQPNDVHDLVGVALPGPEREWWCGLDAHDDVVIEPDRPAERREDPVERVRADELDDTGTAPREDQVRERRTVDTDD